MFYSEHFCFILKMVWSFNIFQSNTDKFTRMTFTPSPSFLNLQTLVPDNYKVNREKDGSMSIILKLIILCGIWYCSSAINSITLKRFVQYLHTIGRDTVSKPEFVINGFELYS